MFGNFVLLSFNELPDSLDHNDSNTIGTCDQLAIGMMNELTKWTNKNELTKCWCWLGGENEESPASLIPLPQSSQWKELKFISSFFPFPFPTTFLIMYMASLHYVYGASPHIILIYHLISNLLQTHYEGKGSEIKK